VENGCRMNHSLASESACPGAVIDEFRQRVVSSRSAYSGSRPRPVIRLYLSFAAKLAFNCLWAKRLR
jgi:hypothetical protein